MSPAKQFPTADSLQVETQGKGKDKLQKLYSSIISQLFFLFLSFICKHFFPYLPVFLPYPLFQTTTFTYRLLLIMRRQQSFTFSHYNTCQDRRKKKKKKTGHATYGTTKLTCQSFLSKKNIMKSNAGKLPFSLMLIALLIIYKNELEFLLFSIVVSYNQLLLPKSKVPRSQYNLTY